MLREREFNEKGKEEWLEKKEYKIIAPTSKA